MSVIERDGVSRTVINMKHLFSCHDTYLVESLKKLSIIILEKAKKNLNKIRMFFQGTSTYLV